MLNIKMKTEEGPVSTFSLPGGDLPPALRQLRHGTVCQ